VQKLITEVRRFRTEQGLPDRRRVAARIGGLDAVGLAASGSGGAVAALRTLARLDAPGGDFVPTATVEVALPTGTVHVELDTSRAIDVPAERARLTRDLAVAQKELGQAEKKLGNPKFLANAPGDVVEGIRTRRAMATAELERITARLAALPGA
jgi:valyl-tRNA synthetase